jgi:hypothetical protein
MLSRADATQEKIMQLMAGRAAALETGEGTLHAN